MEGGRATMFRVVDLKAAIREGIKPHPLMQAGSTVHANNVSLVLFFSVYYSLGYYLLLLILFGTILYQ